MGKVGKRPAVWLCAALASSFVVGNAIGGPPWGAPVTLETGPDNGFLNCALKGLKPEFRNGATDQAFSNLAGKPNAASTAVLSGHGLPGLICTGDGEQCGVPGTIVRSGNVAQWKDFARKIGGKFSSILLLGCEIGAEPAGAQLLSEMAEMAKVPVVAPTALVYCKDGKIWIDSNPNGQLQKASPGSSKPKAIPRPKIRVKPTGIFNVWYKNRTLKVGSADVRVLRFEYRVAPGLEFRLVDRPERALRLVNLIDFSQPVEPGTPAAIVTARILLEIRIEDRWEPRDIVIYNDEIAQDLGHPTTIYRADSTLGEALESLRQSLRRSGL